MKYSISEINNRVSKRIGCKPQEARLLIETVFDVIREIMWEEDTESLTIPSFIKLEKYMLNFNQYMPILERTVCVNEPRLKGKLSHNFSHYKHQIHLLDFDNDETKKTP